MKLRQNPKKTEKALDSPASVLATPPKLQPQTKLARRNSSGPSTSLGRPSRNSTKTGSVEENVKDTSPSRVKDKPPTLVSAVKSLPSVSKQDKPGSEPGDAEKRKTRRTEEIQQVKEPDNSDTKTTEVTEKSEKAPDVAQGIAEKVDASAKPSTRSRLTKVGTSNITERRTPVPNPAVALTKMEDVAKLIVKDASRREPFQDKTSVKKPEAEPERTASRLVKKVEKTTPIQQKRKAPEPEETSTASKRLRVSRLKNKEDVDSGTEAGDEKAFERFYSKVKNMCAVSEKWNFSGVTWDQSKNIRTFAVSEVDISSNGNMRLRRSVQVFDNKTVRVVIEGSEMTTHFLPAGSVESANDVSQLIHKVATSKICAGIKNFGTTDKVYFPHCVLRGESYFAPECPIVIDGGIVGPLCAHCCRLKNMIQRRNVKETSLLYSKFSRAPVKNVRSGFGKQLYSMLTDMVESSSLEARKERKKLKRMVSTREFPSSHPEIIRLSKPFASNNGQQDVMTINVLPNQRGSYKVAREGGMTTTITGGNLLTPSEMQMVEQLVLQEGGDVGNVIIQNSSEFTLAEGQEYELIGEADSSNPIQVLELKEDNEENNTIEIIEVDDQTLAQLTQQNMGNFIIQEPSAGFEVQEIDANDPNFRHLVKALNPGSVVYQT